MSRLGSSRYRSPLFRTMDKQEKAEQHTRVRFIPAPNHRRKHLPSVSTGKVRLQSPRVKLAAMFERRAVGLDGETHRVPARGRARDSLQLSSRSGLREFRGGAF